jgi:hypothetical protein
MKKYPTNFKELSSMLKSNEDLLSLVRQANMASGFNRESHMKGYNASLSKALSRFKNAKEFTVKYSDPNNSMPSFMKKDRVIPNDSEAQNEIESRLNGMIKHVGASLVVRAVSESGKETLVFNTKNKETAALKPTSKSDFDYSPENIYSVIEKDINALGLKEIKLQTLKDSEGNVTVNIADARVSQIVDKITTKYLKKGLGKNVVLSYGANTANYGIWVSKEVSLALLVRKGDSSIMVLIRGK